MEGIIKQLSGFSKIFFSSFLLVVSPWLFFACGLETYYVMDSVPRVEYRPNYIGDDYDGRYFDFYAVQKLGSENYDFPFLGTYVYYKIYSDSDEMNRNHNRIEAVNNSTNYSAAAERMIGLGYKELNTNNGSRSPLIANKTDGIDYVRVRIRLTNYGKSESNSDEYKAQILIGGNLFGIPRRSRGPNYSFDFGRKDDPKYIAPEINYDAPASGDEDFSGSSPSDKYYVDMYAVAACRDRKTFAKYYGNVAYLGSITINAKDPDN